MTNFLLNSKYIISTLVALVTFIIFLFVYKKYKLTKYQLFVFIIFVVFWSSIVIIRSYRKIYVMGDVSLGGLGLDETLAVSVVAAYGLISIFVRLPIFALSDFFKSRKFFVMLSLLFIGISSIVVYFNPNYTSMLVSSLALGVGASLISMFNVMFSETFDKVEAIKSVSILSIAPLFAEFIMAPVQYIFTKGTMKDYSSLWLISACLAFIGVICLIFFKDNKTKVRNFSFKKIGEVLKNKYFIVICILGIVCSFIKFSTSGANFLAYVKLEEIGMSPLGIAYADVIFSFSQLIAGVLAGIYLKKKIGVKKTLSIGLILSILFCIVVMFIKNPTILFISYSLNGFSYGLTYNVLIGLAMQPFEKNYREISMGIYQTFFAIGIYFGDVVYKYIYNLVSRNSLLYSYTRVYGITGIIATVTLIIFIITFKNNNEFLEK